MSDEQQKQDTQDMEQHTPDTQESDTEASKETEVVNEVHVDYKDKYLRAHADYQNLVRETNTRRAEWAQMSEIQVIEAFIPVYDNFKKAAAHTPEDASNGWKNWAMGITFIQKQFADVLRQFGVEEMKVVGEVFDPSRHESVGEEVSEEYADGMIIREVESGYVKAGKVMKPAKVVVSKQDASE